MAAHVAAVAPRLPPVAAQACLRLLKGADGVIWEAARTALKAAAAGPAEGDAEGRLAGVFPREALPAAPRPEAPAQPPELLAEDPIAALFEPGGAFSRALAGYEHRAGQVELVRHVVRAFNESRHLLAEGGTGIGKSMAYLVPALLWARANRCPVVVSTNTKNLQSQLFEKDLPQILRALGLDARVALVKGRLNYLCLRKLLFALDHAADELTPQERRLTAGVLAWAAASGTGDLTTCPGWGREDAATLAHKLTATGDECMGRACRYAARCFLLRARAKARAADVVVANHALVFAEMGLESQVLPPYQHLVLDEAHNLEEAATQHFSVEWSPGRLRHEFGRLWKAAPRHDGFGLVPAVIRQIRSGVFTGDQAVQQDLARHAFEILDALRAAEGRTEDLFSALGDLLPGAGPQVLRLIGTEARPAGWVGIVGQATEVQASYDRLITRLQDLSRAIRGADSGGLPLHGEAVHDLDGAARRFQELALQLEFVTAAEESGNVFWVEKTGGRGRSEARMWAAPVSIGERLASDLYARMESVVFSSATLSVGGSYAFLQARLGLGDIPAERLLTCRADSPFDFRRQCVVRVPSFLPEPGGDDGSYADALGRLLADVFRRTRGRGMALFTSYEMLRSAARVTERELAGSGIRVLVQGESGSREEILEAFTLDVSSVLLGTHSFWEGVDAAGETLSCLVIARLPFGVFTDPIIAARCGQVELEGGQAFKDYSLPAAVIRFRQGFGRLIRTRADRGVVIVADRRVLTRGYGRAFRGSLPVDTLPSETLTSLLDEVEAFLER
jgi:Rad3-related DNA helicase